MSETNASTPADDGAEDRGAGTYRAVKAIRRHLTGGAVLRFNPSDGGFILEASTGAELARASRTSELAAILDALAGKAPRKGRVILCIGQLLPAAARVRFTGESLNALVKTAVAAEVARRSAAFDAELADLDGAEVARA